MAGLILVLGGFRVMDGALSIGRSFHLSLARALLPVNNLMARRCCRIRGDITRFDDVLQHRVDEQPVPSMAVAGWLSAPRAKNLRFAYNPTSRRWLTAFR